MFRQKTTVIVGAGASCELGLPSGDELKGRILNLLSPTNDHVYGFSAPIMVEYMKGLLGPNVWEHASKLGPVKAAAERIRRGLPLAMSIDNFLHSHQGDEEVERLGKLTIAMVIASAERNSFLFRRMPATMRLVAPDHSPEFTITNEALDKTWYPAFARLLMAGSQRQDIAAVFANVNFVVFNYDRCLEQYLWMALQDYFDIAGEDAAEIMSRVEFVHPYGHLGPLPWQSENGPVELGGGILSDYSRMISRIRTFTESVRSDVGGRVKRAVATAHTLLILGFGYLDQNIQLLTSPGGMTASRAFSTAYGVSEADQRIMRGTMTNLGSMSVDDTYIEPGSCRDLFDHFRLTLSLR